MLKTDFAEITHSLLELHRTQVIDSRQASKEIMRAVDQHLEDLAELERKMKIGRRAGRLAESTARMVFVIR
jgi:hypothetical protein